MKILVDENMPYALDLFSSLGQVTEKSGREIIADDLIDIDALIIRSITQVNPSLLEKANKLKFIGTATAGFDHVDVELLKQKGIHFEVAAGCNKIGVAEYVISALLNWSQLNQFLSAKQTNLETKSLFEKTVGIIGAGQVGSYLAECLTALGIKVLLNDPPKQAQGDPRDFVELDYLLEHADVISLHTPMTKIGEFSTYHLLNSERIQKLRSDQLLINAARDAVIDNQALKLRLLQRESSTEDSFQAVLDVFEAEPQVDFELVEKLLFATPHIAGYSLEGKVRGTSMIYNAFCDFVHKNALVNSDLIKPLEDVNTLLPEPTVMGVHVNQDWENTKVFTEKETVLSQITQLIYDIRRDDKEFRQAMQVSSEPTVTFDQLRKNYWQRREYSSLIIFNENNQSPLCAVGFNANI